MPEMDFDDVAAAWSRWWPIFERGAQPLSTRIVELSSAGPGARVLDLATGLGEPALSIARAVSPGGHVVAIDVSPSMLRLARKRAADEGGANVDFIEADAGAYDGGEPFDAIVSRWGLMFLSDAKGALKHNRRQLAPAGRFVAAVWGEPREVPMISLPMLVAMQTFEMAPPPVEGGPFALADVAKLRDLFEETGYRDIGIEDFPVTYTFASPGEYYDHIFDVAPPLRALRARLDDAESTRLRAGVERTVRERFADGSDIRIPNRAIVVSASPGAQGS